MTRTSRSQASGADASGHGGLLATVAGLRLPALPYPLDALEPHLSARTLALHHGRHHRGYVERTKELAELEGRSDVALEQLVRDAEGALLANASQAWNHAFYWTSMTPEPEGWIDDRLLLAIRERFGDAAGLQRVFRETALGVLGSGWVWLVRGTDGIEVLATKDADCPLREGWRPLIVCDVWEHAYYLDHQNERGKYVDSWWRLVDWEFASRNFVG